MPFREGEQVGSYRILEQLGRGGMATVFKAYHASLDRYVAIKVLHPAFLEDETFKVRFEREAKVVAKLEHPNIIPIYDYSEHNGHPFLVMKYIEGETLKARLKRSPLTPEEGGQVIRAIGSGLAYAHSQGILHRDIKPSNVMISQEGQIYLADFGLARIASAGETTISSDMLLGTPQYISPEQARGRRKLDEGTDIYSFGVLIYELVVGKVPFNADTPYSIVHDHIYSPLPLPSSVNPNVPEVIERLLLKALAKHRAARFETVEEMVNAFTKAIQGRELGQVWVDPDKHTPMQTPQPVQIIRKSQALAPVDAGSDPVSGSSQTNKPLSQWRWYYSIPLGALLCVFLLVVIGLLSDRPEENLPLPFLPEPTEDNSAAEAGEDQTVLDAEQKVTEYPDDPYAYLDLAGAYLDSGKTERAWQAFDKGLATAGEDGTYFITAGDMLIIREYWVDGLEQYRAAIKIDPDLITSANEPKFEIALYQAAADSEAQPLLFGLDSETFPKDLSLAALYAAQARFHLLVFNQPEIGLNLIADAFAAEQDCPMARLVQAEIYNHQGRTNESVEILEILVEEEGVHAWIQNEARKLLGN